MECKRFVVVQSLSCFRLIVTSWTAAHQGPPSSTVSRNFLKFMSIWVCDAILINISSSAIPFSFCLQSFPALGSFPISWLFASGGQSIRASTSASVFWINIQGWFHEDWVVWSPCSPRDSSRVFSSTTIQKHQFFGTQPSLWSNSHICTWLLEKP